MNNYVISLQSATDRRAHIEQEFAKHKVEFEFFDALTPDKATEFAATLPLKVADSNLTAGEIACMMSHVALWKKTVDENIPYITIFEDDIYLGEDAQSMLNDYQWIKPEWHIIKIEAFAKKTYISNKSHEVLKGKRRVVQLQGKNLGTAGYILSNKGAQTYLDYIQSHALLPLDRLMFDDFITHSDEPVQQLIPAICIQEMLLHKDNPSLPSALLKERKDRMKSEKKQGLAKLNKEVNRLGKQVKKSLFAKEVPFK